MIARRIKRAVAAPAAIVAAAAAVGRAAASGKMPAIAMLALMLGIPVVSMSPAALSVVAFPGVVLIHRVNVGGLGLSYADFVLVLVAGAIVRAVPWHLPVIRRLFRIAVTYFVIVAVTTAFASSTKSVVELFHRAELVGGSFIIGATCAVHGYRRLALRLYIAATSVIALGAIEFALTNGLAPAFPFGIHKNAAGFFLLASMLLLIVARKELAIPGWYGMALQVLHVIGILACQSRAAAATLGIAVAVHAVRSRARGSIVALVGVACLGAMIWTTSQGLTDSNNAGAQFNSYYTRINVYEQATRIWLREPIFGAGLRYWNDANSVPGEFLQEPHNVVLSGLAESGVVGIAALVLLNAQVIGTFRRRRDEIGRCAMFLVIAHIADSMAGIYWVAGTGTLPWLIAGLAAYEPPDPAEPGAQTTPDVSWRRNCARGVPVWT